jgi:hypothetical protein
MNKLRQVLGDSPERPVYVETIPRRGYCFIANVEFSSVADAPLEQPSKLALEENSQAVAHQAVWFKEHLPALVKAASLVFAGIILGALLTFVWFFAAAKSQHSATKLRVNTFVTRARLQNVLS